MSAWALLYLFCVGINIDAEAATFVVDSTVDAVDATPGNGVCATSGAICTLRAAIQESNALAGADTVTVPAGTYTLTIAGTSEDAAATGDLDITENLTLNGAGASTTIVDGNSLDRVFEILGVTASISGITIRNGNATVDGGGIDNGGTAILAEVTVSGNTAISGGGIANEPGASLTISDSTLSGNTASNRGGAIRDRGTAVLTNVTISGNNAGVNGGGIIFTNGTTLLNVTITGNTASNGGGVYKLGGNKGLSTAKNTIIAANPGGGDCFNNFTSLGNNLDSDSSCPFGITDPVPLLGPLQDNGGPTFTHALLTGSPAIDAGTNTGCPATDQRGIGRPNDGPGRTRTHALADSHESEINEADRS